MGVYERLLWARLHASSTLHHFSERTVELGVANAIASSSQMRVVGCSCASRKIFSEQGTSPLPSSLIPILPVIVKISCPRTLSTKYIHYTKNPVAILYGSLELLL